MENGVEKENRMYMVQTVSKAFRVLKVMAENQRSMSISEIAKQANIYKSVCYRMLVTMTEDGIVTQAGHNGGYKLGLGLVKLGMAALEKNDLSSIAKGIIERLMHETGESVYLNVESAGERICIAKADSPHTIRHYIALGVALPLHAGAGGKVLLAAYSRQMFDEYMDSKKPSLSGAPKLLDREELWAELEEVRTRGVAWSYMERTEDAASVGSAIRDNKGKVVASIAIAGPATRFETKDRSELEALVVRASNDISRILGFIPGKTEQKWEWGSLG